MNPNIPNSSSNQDSLISEPTDNIAPTYKEIQSAVKENQIDNLRKVKLFPIFNDENLAKVSINYWLYLEIFNICIKLLFPLLIVISIVHGAFYFLQPDVNVTKHAPAQIGLFITIMCLAVFQWVRQEKAALSHRYIKQYQWTENLFSFVIDNIPVKSTKEEVKKMFDGLPSMKIAKGSIKEVILIKEFSSYAKLRRKHKDLAEKIDNATTKKDLIKRSKKMEALEKKLFNVETKIHDSDSHKGAAIVTFNSMFIRKLILNRLSPSVVRTIDRYLGMLSGKKQLDERFIDAVEVPEPQDLIIDNISYSKLLKDFRRLLYLILVIALTVILTFIVFFVTSYAAGFSIISQDFTDPDLITISKVLPYIVSAILIIANTLSNKIYKYLNMLNLSLSKFESNMNLIKHSIRSAIINYLIVQVTIVSAAFSLQKKAIEEDFLEGQMFKTIAMYCVKTVGKKIAFAFINSNTMKAPGKKPKTLFGKLLRRIQTKSPEFDYVEGVQSIIPLLAMTFGFIMARSYTFVPISIITIYFIAIIDKYSITRSCEPFSLNSAQYMLSVFLVAKWCISYLFIGTILVMLAKAPFLSRDPSESGSFSIASWGVCLVSFIGFIGSFCFLGFPSSIKNKFKDKFVKENWRSDYDKVCHNFKTFFRRVDYSFQIEEKLTALNYSKDKENSQL